MKTSKIFLIFIIIFFSCDNNYQSTRHICTCEQLKTVNEFVGKHIKDANNMADEEMEDVIAQLQKTAIEINCPQKVMWIRKGSTSINWEKEKILDSCKSVFDY